MRLSGFVACGLAASSHAALAEEEPVEGDILLGRHREQEIRVRCGAALVAIDVLLKYAEVSRELPLGPIASNLCNSFGKFLLQSIDRRCCRHADYSSFTACSSEAGNAQFFLMAGTTPTIAQNKQVSSDVPDLLAPGRTRRWALTKVNLKHVSYRKCGGRLVELFKESRLRRHAGACVAKGVGISPQRLLAPSFLGWILTSRTSLRAGLRAATCHDEPSSES